MKTRQMGAIPPLCDTIFAIGRAIYRRGFSKKLESASQRAFLLILALSLRVVLGVLLAATPPII